MAQEVILRLDMAQDVRALTEEEAQLWKDLKVRVLGLASVERSRRCQSLRLTYLREGDAGTKFFHLKANARCRKNFIPNLKKEDGYFLWFHEEKEAEIHSHFHHTMGTKVQRRCTFQCGVLDLGRIDASDLDRIFTEEEIWAAIQQMPSEKAPGWMVSQGLSIKFVGRSSKRT